MHFAFKFVALAGAAVSISISNATANDKDLHPVIDDIVITSDLPDLMITVRNIAQSTNPADRDLRVIGSTNQDIMVSGELHCQQSDVAQNAARKAQVMYGDVSINDYNNQLMYLGTSHSHSDVLEFGGTTPIRHFQIDAPVSYPEHHNALVNLAPFDPIGIVEARMDSYVQNNVGSQADFLRTDDVFETPLRMNLIGWCHYQGGSINEEFVGYNSQVSTARIFYQGDGDIQEPHQVTPGNIQAPAVGLQRAQAENPPRARNDAPRRRN